ncbi:MAG: hypothetical protein M1834_002066 [Cirrosporium novae-zelandiae]|nr:MAG: hypothetical protein M1834_002066 [Cirrosporium novae-zelandiae]
MPDQYRQYEGSSDPQIFFNKVLTYHTNLQELITNLKNPFHFETAMTKNMIVAIFGSNQIERVGLGLDETIKICEQIFEGESVDAEVSEGSEEYEKALVYLIAKLKKGKGEENHKPSKELIIQSRREVIQHARVLQYITNALVIKDQLMTEDLIKETHRILTKGIDHVSGTPSTI